MSCLVVVANIQMVIRGMVVGEVTTTSTELGITTQFRMVAQPGSDPLQEPVLTRKGRAQDLEQRGGASAELWPRTADKRARLKAQHGTRRQAGV